MMVEELDDVLAVWKANLMDDDLVSKLVVLRENNWVDVVAVEWEELTADGLDFVSVGMKELTLSDKKEVFGAVQSEQKTAVEQAEKLDQSMAASKVVAMAVGKDAR
eukprot:gene30137-biopygen24286